MKIFIALFAVLLLSACALPDLQTGTRDAAIISYEVGNTSDTQILTMAKNHCATVDRMARYQEDVKGHEPGTALRFYECVDRP